MKNIIKFLSIFILFSCSPSEKELESPSEEELELTQLGSWITTFFVDEFGDRTGEKSLGLKAYGTYYENQNLTVVMLLRNGEKDKIDFRFYEYGGEFAESNDYSYTLFLNCKIKIGADDESNIFPIYLYQEPQRHQFLIDDTKTTDASTQKLRNLIQNEDKAKFLCTYENNINRKYRFDLNFKYFSNAQRIYELGDELDD